MPLSVSRSPGGSPVTLQSWMAKPSTVLKPGMDVLGMVKMALERLKAGESLPRRVKIRANLARLPKT